MSTLIVRIALAEPMANLSLSCGHIRTSLTGTYCPSVRGTIMTRDRAPHLFDESAARY